MSEMLRMTICCPKTTDRDCGVQIECYRNSNVNTRRHALADAIRSPDALAEASPTEPPRQRHRGHLTRAIAQPWTMIGAGTVRHTSCASRRSAQVHRAPCRRARAGRFADRKGVSDQNGQSSSTVSASASVGIHSTGQSSGHSISTGRIFAASFSARRLARHIARAVIVSRS